jgi:hypothetical protein
MAKRKSVVTPTKSTNELTDEGILEINVKGGEHAGRISVDVMAMYFAIHPLHKKHNVGTKGWNATADFLNDLAAVVSKQLGWEKCSTGFAFDLWHKISRAWVALKKNMHSMQS